MANDFLKDEIIAPVLNSEKNISNFGINLGDAIGFGTAQRDREFNAQEAQKQRDWEERMSNTAYQRGVKDMEAAGLNPAMMYSNSAGGASTPNGASAKSSAINNNIATFINSAANLSNSFNSDRNRANDVNSRQMVDTITDLAKLLM